jgi:inner membrane protein
MMLKTHLAISVMILLLFLPHVNHRLIFIPVLLFVTIIPDLDSYSSALGKHWIFRPIQLFLSHRGLIHSFTICFILSLAFAFYFPIIALPFFLGYSSHIFADSFTVDGIKPFWPMKYETKGLIRTGGSVEQGLFFVFIFISIILFMGLFWNL